MLAAAAVAGRADACVGALSLRLYCWATLLPAPSLTCRFRFLPRELLVVVAGLIFQGARRRHRVWYPRGIGLGEGRWRRRACSAAAAAVAVVGRAETCVFVLPSWLFAGHRLYLLPRVVVGELVGWYRVILTHKGEQSEERVMPIASGRAGWRVGAAAQWTECRVLVLHNTAPADLAITPVVL